MPVSRDFVQNMIIFTAPCIPDTAVKVNTSAVSILETGEKQTEAIRLYTRSGYQCIPNYGQHEQLGRSLCFEKLPEKLQ